MDKTFLLLIVLVVVPFLIVKRWIVGKYLSSNPTLRAYQIMRYYVLIMAAVSMVGVFALPSTPSLATFGYPDNLEAVQSQSEVLRYLQDYNHALVRTIQVIYWFLFVFVWFFLLSFLRFAKSLTSGDSDRQVHAAGQ